MSFASLRKHLNKFAHGAELSRLQKISATGLVALALLTIAQSNVLFLVQKQVDLMLSAVLPGVIVELTNEEREAKKLGVLNRNPLLDEAARLKAENMKAGGYFAHYSPEGISPWYWFDQAGYDYVHAGENLAIYFDETEEVVQGWMDSPLHRDNILRKEYTEIGVAAVEGKYKGYNTVYIVQLFGTPALKVQTVPVVAVAPTPTPVTPTVAENTVQGETAERTTLPIAQEPAKQTPAQVASEPIKVAQSESVIANAEPIKTDEVEVESMPITVVSMDSGVAYMSDHAATTSVGKTAAIVTPSPEANEILSMPRVSASDTGAALQMLFVLASLLIAGLVSASIIAAERHLHHAQAAYGASLLVTLLSLVSLNVYFTHTVSAALF